MNTEIPSIKGVLARILSGFLDRIPEGDFPDTLVFPARDRRAREIEGREIASGKYKNSPPRE